MIATSTPFTHNLKRCTICGEYKPTSEFWRNGNRGADGLKSACIPCTKIRQKELRDLNKNRKPLSPSDIPYRCRPALEIVWPLVGENPFIFHAIENEISRKQGVISLLKKNEIIVKEGYLNSSMRVSIWKINPLKKTLIAEHFGPVNPNAEENCAKSIAEYKTLLRKMINQSQRKRLTSKHERDNRLNELLPYLKKLVEIYGIDDLWECRDLPHKGVILTGFDLQRLKRAGYLKNLPARNRSAWRLTEKAIDWAEGKS